MGDYEYLCKSAEMIEDIVAYDAAIARGQESFPISLYDRIDAGENPVAVFREFRGLTQTSLAEKAKIERSMLGAVDHGKKTGSVATVKAIAEVLDVPLEEIV